MHDLRLALRSLLRSPGYLGVVVATLALGIGGTTAMFTLVDGVLLKPLPYPEPDRLTALYERIPEVVDRYPVLPVNAHHLRQWSAKAGSFEKLALYTWRDETLLDLGEPRRVPVMQVSVDFFSTLGVRVRTGRDFRPGENEPDRGASVIITESFRQRELGADAPAVGRKFTLNARLYEVVGVLPPDFLLFNPKNDFSPFGSDVAQIEIFRPVELRPERLIPNGEFNYAAIGRMKSNVSVDQAESELNVVQAAIAREADGIDSLEAVVAPLRESTVGGSEAALWLGMAAVGVVLLIGCVNISNLTLVRASRLTTEYATRSALGASRASLSRRAAAESMLLAAAGGIAGLMLASTTVAWIGPQVDLPVLGQHTINWRAGFFTIAVSGLRALLFGLAPALRAAGADPARAMRSDSRGGVASRGVRRLQSALAAGQVALSVSLLIVAALLGRSLSAVLTKDRGFEASQTVLGSVSLPPANYDPEGRARAMGSILDRIQAIPGVQAAGLISQLPLTAEFFVAPIIAAEAGPIPPLERPQANFRFASPGYFDAMRIPFLGGESFRESRGGERQAVISARAAELLWPGLDPVGRRIRLGNDETMLTVRGVVANVAVQSLEAAPSAVVYRPYWDRPADSLALAIRSTLGAQALTAASREAIWSVDPDTPAIQFEPAANLVRAATSSRRFQSAILAVFAATALGQACLGVYGVLAQSVGSRTREIGLRLALGARTAELRKQILLQGMRPVAIGLGLGIVSALVAGRWLESLLFEVSPLDPVAYLGAAVLLATAAAAACYLPAQRAAKIEPMHALRIE